MRSKQDLISLVSNLTLKVHKSLGRRASSPETRFYVKTGFLN